MMRTPELLPPIIPEAISSNEKNIPDYQLNIIDTTNLSEQEREEWRQRGLTFLVELDKDTFAKRFGHGKTKKNGELNMAMLESLAETFITKPHYMIAAIDEETNKIIGAGSLFDLKNTPSTAEFSFTVDKPYQDKRLGSTLMRQAINILRVNGYSHVYGYFSYKGRNFDAFNSAMGNPIANKDNDEYFWRIPGVDMSEAHKVTEEVIIAYCKSKTGGDKPDIDPVVDNQRKKYRRSLQKFFKRFISDEQ